MDNLSKDSFFDGSIIIYQNKDGYRFSIDPIILSYHVNPQKKSKILDIGTGCGIIPVSLMYRHKNINITGVEVQKTMFELAEKNINENNFHENINLVNCDIKDFKPQENCHFDIIVSNPPYGKTGSGRINPESEKAVARHEILLNLEDLLFKAKSLLKNKGSFYIIYLANRATELLKKMDEFSIIPKEIRFIHPFNDSPAKLVLCRGILNSNQGAVILPPLFIYQDKNIFSKEMEKIMR